MSRSGDHAGCRTMRVGFALQVYAAAVGYLTRQSATMAELVTKQNIPLKKEHYGKRRKFHNAASYSL